MASDIECTANWLYHRYQIRDLLQFRKQFDDMLVRYLKWQWQSLMSFSQHKIQMIIWNVHDSPWEKQLFKARTRTRFGSYKLQKKHRHSKRTSPAFFRLRSCSHLVHSSAFHWARKERWLSSEKNRPWIREQLRAPNIQFRIWKEHKTLTFAHYIPGGIFDSFS